MEESGGNGKKKTGLNIRKSLKGAGCAFLPGREELRFAPAAAAVILLLAMFFYDTPAAAVFMIPLMGPICRRLSEQKKDRNRQTMVVQFRELMDCIITALKAGRSPENAFREARGDMALLFGEKSPICRELSLIEGGLANNVPLEHLISDFAGRTGADEISEFSEVFAIARKSGGSMTEIMERTVTLIEDRMSVENEIGILISARKLEQKIMDVVPFFIIFYIGITSQGYFDCMYRNAAGIAIMTACLVTYLAAFAIADKMTSIRV